MQMKFMGFKIRILKCLWSDLPLLYKTVLHVTLYLLILYPLERLLILLLLHDNLDLGSCIVQASVDLVDELFLSINRLLVFLGTSIETQLLATLTFQLLLE